MNRRGIIGTVAAVALLASSACAAGGPDPTGREPAAGSRTESMGGAMNIVSDAFAEGQPIPAEYTCDGDNISPPLRWDGAPEGTGSFVLIADDPDCPTGTWVHWVLYDVPATVIELQESVPAARELAGGGRHGENSFKTIGYGGPCPPRGSAHRYYFKLFALDTVLNLEPGASEGEVTRGMAGHVLGQAQTMGTYRRH